VLDCGDRELRGAHWLPGVVVGNAQVNGSDHMRCAAVAELEADLAVHVSLCMTAFFQALAKAEQNKLTSRQAGWSPCF
jgi:hypothetical protein